MEVREARAEYLAKPVFKQTEAGTIPSDWKLIPFAEAVGSYIDYRGRTPRKLGMDWGDGEILALSANNVQAGRIAPEKEAYFGSKALYEKWMVQGDCEIGDVLLTMEAPLGNVAQIPDDRKYILSQRVVLIKPKSWLLRDYLAHFMMGSYFQSLLDSNATGTTAKGIQRAKLDELPIYVPPDTAEQQAIADALGNADALIESLEHLLAKKRQIKQGTMQALLTCQQRLPGFEGRWECRRLADIAPLQRGFDLPTSCLEPGPYPVVYSNGILQKHKHFQVAGPGVVTGRSGTIGNVTYVEDDYWPHNTSLWVTTFKGNNPKFVFFLYSFIGFSRFATGSGVPTLNRNDAHAFEVAIPSDEREQTAIATVLADMDAEIAALDARLAKARALKQGMMQTLLTGRIRLV